MLKDLSIIRDKHTLAIDWSINLSTSYIHPKLGRQIYPEFIK